MQETQKLAGFDKEAEYQAELEPILRQAVAKANELGINMFVLTKAKQEFDRTSMHKIQAFSAPYVCNELVAVDRITEEKPESLIGFVILVTQVMSAPIYQVIKEEDGQGCVLQGTSQHAAYGKEEPKDDEDN